MVRPVLTDASPLIALSKIDALGWLGPLFGVVWMPPKVRREVLTGHDLPGERAIRAALRAGHASEWKRAAAKIVADPLPDLDEGEAACIRITLARAARGDTALLLMDERAGRAVARERGLRVAGTAALIGMAKKRGLIASARDAFARLHDTDFRISPQVISTVLARVGE